MKEHLYQTFSIKDLGDLHYFLGIEEPQKDGMVLTRQKFTNDLLLASGLNEVKQVVTPLPLNTKLFNSDQALFKDPTLYRCLVGNLNFLTNTRPDLTYTAQSHGQFRKSPRISHRKALLHTLNYVLSTCGQGIKLKG